MLSLIEAFCFFININKKNALKFLANCVFHLDDKKTLTIIKEGKIYKETIKNSFDFTIIIQNIYNIYYEINE